MKAAGAGAERVERARREIFPSRGDAGAAAGAGAEGAERVERARREIFPSLVPRDLARAEERSAAEFEWAFARCSQAVSRAAGRRGAWVDRVRRGLVALLRFLDDEPACAWLLFVRDGVGDDALARERRVRGILLAVLGDREAHGTIFAHERAPHGAPHERAPHERAPHERAAVSADLISELVVGGVCAVIRTSILEGRDAGPLLGLAPSLLSFVLTPYLGQAVTGAKLAHAFDDQRRHGMTLPSGERLPIRITHRTTVVLKAIADAPCASNRDVARIAEIVDEGQASKLLARLAHRGLIENLSRGAETGEPNAWRLTAEGERVLELIGRAPLHPPRRRVKGAAGVGEGEDAAHARSGERS